MAIVPTWGIYLVRLGNRLPQEAVLKLRSVPRAPKELPATAFIGNPHEVADWKLFVSE